MPGPAQSGGDPDPEVHGRTLEGELEQESTQHQVCPGPCTVYIYVVMETVLTSTLKLNVVHCDQKIMREAIDQLHFSV